MSSSDRPNAPEQRGAPDSSYSKAHDTVHDTVHDKPHDTHVVHADVGAAPSVRPASTRRMMMVGAAVAIVLVLLLVSAILPRRALQRDLKADVTAQDSAPVVMVTVVHRAAAGSELLLPGTIQALHESAIYGRVPGYVKSWHADIGSFVRKDEVLADIDAPELEQEVQQAQQQVAQSRAALGLARADLERWRTLASDSAVSRQEFDQKQAAYDVATASTGGAEANLRRLNEMRHFTKVSAPFAGVITARNVDIGSLIASTGGTSAPIAAGGGATGAGSGSLFRVAETDTVRTYISVPESYATSIKVGLVADVLVQELPGRTFVGRVVRTAHSLDVASRTLLTEIDIYNKDLSLLPGMFAQVRLHFARVTPPLLLPASALVIRSDGPQVMAIHDGTGSEPTTVQFRPVEIGRDYGATIEIAAGITDGMRIVVNPNADLSDGSRVRPMLLPASDRSAAVAPIAPAAGARPIAAPTASTGGVPAPAMSTAARDSAARRGK